MYILLFCVILFTVGIWWGLPNSESWLSDALAPFHPLLGLSKGFSFGYFNKYPIVHQVILAVLNLPVVITALVKSNPLEGLQVFKFLVLLRSPSYATALILIDRLVSAVMGALIVYYMYRSVREIFSERAALFSAMFLSVNAALNFYAHVSKVEVPYLFWGVLAIYKLIHVIKYEKTRDYILLAVFTCLCFGTKDQGYAIFILPFVIYLVLLPLWNRSGKGVAAVLFRRELLVFAAVFIAGTVVVENLIFNWEGFILRFEHLTGEGGTRSIGYANDLTGNVLLIKDNLIQISSTAMGNWPFAVSMFGIFIMFIQHRSKGRELLVKSVFLVASVSFYLFFVQFIRQANVRFTLVQSIFLTAYGGFAMDFLFSKMKGYLRIIPVILLAVSLGCSLYNTVSVNANFLMDVRYEVEEWMRENIPEGAVIEYYAYEHYLPRFPDGTRSYRIKSDVTQIEKRKPDFIVCTSHYYPRYFLNILDIVQVMPGNTGEGRIVPDVFKRLQETGFPNFYMDLAAGRLNYRLEMKFKDDITFFKKIRFSRLSPDMIFIYKRTSPGE